jgi:hypothetical protein
VARTNLLSLLHATKANVQQVADANLEQAEAMGTFNTGVVVFTACGQKP